MNVRLPMRMLIVSALAGTTLVSMQTAALATSPSNDNFADAMTISGVSQTSSVWVDNTGATLEAGEPQPAGVAGGASVWFRWTAPVNGRYSFGTYSSTSTQGQPMDTTLGIYTGSDLTGLTVVAENNDVTPDDTTSYVTFVARAGDTFDIVVDGAAGQTGNIRLGWRGLPPLNDDFANAQPLSGDTGSVPGSRFLATRETGEPDHAGAGGHSVWYSWTAPNDTPVEFDTAQSASSFDSVIAAYTGTTVDALTPVAANDDIGSGNLRSRIVLSPTASTTYAIAVDGNSGDLDFTLAWSPVGADVTGPTITNVQPAAGATVQGSRVPVTFDVTDDVAVDRVVVAIDDTTISTTSSVPFGADFNSTTLSNGTHTLAVTSTDAAGNGTTARNVFTVDNVYGVSNLRVTPSLDRSGRPQLTVSWTLPDRVAGAHVCNPIAVGSQAPPSTCAGADIPAGQPQTHTFDPVASRTGWTVYVYTWANVPARLDSYSPSLASTDASAATITASASHLIAGQSVTLSGLITDVSPRPMMDVPPLSAQLWKRVGAGVWKIATTATSSSTRVTAAQRPTATTQYQWRYTGKLYSGGIDALNAAASPIKIVTVAPAITVTRTAASILLGHTVKTYGVVTPSAAGQYVYLQRLYKTGWRTVAHTKIARQRLPNGSYKIGYVIAYQPSARGGYRLRCYRPATTTNTSGATRTFGLTVK